jgi:phage terminase large subunit-like protein
MPRRKKEEITAERLARRKLAESSLEEFIALVQPNRLLGNIHREVIQWWRALEQRNQKYQLVLLPRDHMKSALIGYRAVWELTKDPTLRILYISSTSNLAVKQLKFMKDILTSDNYRIHWPEMIKKEEAKREKWTEREISVDHPLRRKEAIRDPSIFTAGLTTNIVGMHCDIAILDDVVEEGNSYIQVNRDKVKDQYSLLSSIESADAKEWVIGTRYHPDDLYGTLIQMETNKHDEFGNTVGDPTPLFEVFQRQVESVGDGTGEFLWPRQQRSDGKWFGFDARILADKREKYVNKTHFRAQYYNDPHDSDSAPISRESFQYYDRNYLFQREGRWYFKGTRINVVAAVDFAYSTGRKSDYTSIVVVGADGNGNYYVLDIDRFRTDRISDYFTRILKLYEKWGFRKIRCEVSVAQAVIVKDLKENYIRPFGLSLVVEEYRPSRWQGSKEERIMATLEPKYSNRQMWHYLGGHCQILEEELMFTNPAHDDVKDALAAAVDFMVAPVDYLRMVKNATPQYNYHRRFGGVL